MQTCTLRDLVPEGRRRADETDPEVARLKASADMVRAIEPAVGSTRSRRPRGWRSGPRGPTSGSSPTTGPRRSSRSSPGRRTTRRRDQVWEELLTILVDKHDADVEDPTWLRRVARSRTASCARPSNRAWPLIDPAELVGDLWSVPAYLRRCAPWLSPDEVRRLQRPDAQAWTASDLPLLDAARQRLGDPEASRRQRRREAAARRRAGGDDAGRRRT